MANKALQMTDEFMCQAWGATVDDMVICGMELSEPDRNRIVVKVPVTMNGVRAASQHDRHSLVVDHSAGRSH